MTITDVLQSVQFVVDREGRATAAVIDLTTWEQILDTLEEIEDLHIVRERMQNWQHKTSWMDWDAVKAEFAQEAETDHAVPPLDS